MASPMSVHFDVGNGNVALFSIMYNM